MEPRVSSRNGSASRRIQRLVAQLRYVTRISTALTSTMRIDDLQSIILSALVAPDGLGYSRAMFFGVDRATNTLRGKVLVGPSSRSEARAIQRALKAERDYVRQKTLEALPANPQTPLLSTQAGEALQTLQDSNYWISLFQDTPGTRSTPLSRPLTDHTEPVIPLSGARPTLLQWAASLRRPAIASPEAGSPPSDPGLEPFLFYPLIAMPLRTPKGLRGVIFVDRRFARNTALLEEDLQELDWFALQAALAIENAELIEDLEGAFQQLKELDTLKSNFLSILSHELRTPMTAIMGFMDLLVSERAGPLQEGQRTLLVRASKNAHHLMQILNDLLEVTEVQAEGMRDIKLRPIDPLAILFNVLPRLDQRRREKNIDVEPIVSGALPAILCDAKSLERILFHLLDNAIKFSDKGRRVEVRYEIHEDHMDIQVVDEGIGISVDRLKHIFDTFYQADNRLTRSYEGLGLGLTVTRMLIQATHGEITVRSTPGKGSTFTVRYPLAPSNETPVLGTA